MLGFVLGEGRSGSSSSRTASLLYRALSFLISLGIPRTLSRCILRECNQDGYFTDNELVQEGPVIHPNTHVSEWQRVIQTQTSAPTQHSVQRHAGSVLSNLLSGDKHLRRSTKIRRGPLVMAEPSAPLCDTHTPQEASHFLVFTSVGWAG